MSACPHLHLEVYGQLPQAEMTYLGVMSLPICDRLGYFMQFHKIRIWSWQWACEHSPANIGTILIFPFTAYKIPKSLQSASFILWPNRSQAIVSHCPINWSVPFPQYIPRRSHRKKTGRSGVCLQSLMEWPILGSPFGWAQVVLASWVFKHKEVVALSFILWNIRTENGESHSVSYQETFKVLYENGACTLCPWSKCTPWLSEHNMPRLLWPINGRRLCWAKKSRQNDPEQGCIGRSGAPSINSEGFIKSNLPRMNFFYSS